MELIELTKEWAVRIVLCTNAEVLEIDDEGLGSTKSEMVTSAVGAAQDALYGELGDFGEEDGYFANWKGGKFACTDLIHVAFYRQEIEIDQAQVPIELRQKVESAVEKASEARGEALDQYEEHRVSVEEVDEED